MMNSRHNPHYHTPSNYRVISARFPQADQDALLFGPDGQIITSTAEEEPPDDPEPVMVGPENADSAVDGDPVMIMPPANKAASSVGDLGHGA